MLVGFDTSDDAAVYQISPEICLIHTLDFFPPLVDDPYEFGQIAAANALSDIYAMGGKPVSALNIVCLPSDLDLPSAKAILAGGNDKVLEAGINISGGHSLADKEPKYGLSVTGVVHPEELILNRGAKTGDRLVLTKPIGSGVLSTVDKAGLLSAESHKTLVATMSLLNKRACEIAKKYQVSAGTDVTGFGLIGHALEIAESSDKTLVIKAEEVPLLPEALKWAEEGFLPGGAYRNREYVAGRCLAETDVARGREDLFYDPQTSGGLLLCVAAEKAADFLQDLIAAGLTAAIIGSVEEFSDCRIRVIS